MKESIEYTGNGNDAIPAYKKMAEIYMDTDNKIKAYECYDTVFSISKDKRYKTNFLEFLLDNNQYDKLFKSIDKYNLEGEEILEIKYEAYMDMEKYGNAMETAKKLVGLNESTEHRIMYSDSLRKLNRIDEAPNILKNSHGFDAEIQKFECFRDKGDYNTCFGIIAE